MRLCIDIKAPLLPFIFAICKLLSVFVPLYLPINQRFPSLSATLFDIELSNPSLTLPILVFLITFIQSTEPSDLANLAAILAATFVLPAAASFAPHPKSLPVAKRLVPFAEAL